MALGRQPACAIKEPPRAGSVLGYSSQDARVVEGPRGQEDFPCSRTRRSHYHNLKLRSLLGCCILYCSRRAHLNLGVHGVYLCLLHGGLAWPGRCKSARAV